MMKVLAWILILKGFVLSKKTEIEPKHYFTSHKNKKLKRLLTKNFSYVARMGVEPMTSGL
jgi:hypothetical protein